MTCLPEAPLSPALLERSLRWNMAAGCLGMMWMTVALGMPLPLFMEAIGASGVQLGLLAGAWQFAMLAQVASALATEALPRRKPFWASVSVVHRLLWLAPCVVPVVLAGRREWWPVVIIAALALSNFLAQAGTSLWQGWMADLLPPERAGRFWGVRQRVLSLGLVVAALAFGAILDGCATPEHPLLGFQIVFAVASLLGVGDIVTHCTVFEPQPVRVLERRALRERLAAPLRQPGFLRFTLAMAVWAGAQAMLGYNMGLPGFFAMVYLKEHAGVTYGQAALVFVASGLGGALWAPSVGRWIDRWGGRRVMLGLMTLGPLTMLAWIGVTGERWTLPLGGGAYPQAVVWMGAVSLILGGIYASAWVCQVSLTQSLTTVTGRTVAMGLHWSLVGLIGSMGPLLAGWIKDHLAGAWHGLNYYQWLVMLHLVLVWGVAWPLVRGLMKKKENTL